MSGPREKKLLNEVSQGCGLSRLVWRILVRSCSKNTANGIAMQQEIDLQVHYLSRFDCGNKLAGCKQHSISYITAVFTGTYR